jgi:Zn-finger nucleic acid-binding protein
MTLAAMDGLQVEHCEDCQGVLVLDEIFALLVRNRRAEYRGAASRPTPINPDLLATRVPCPTCRRSMEVHPFYGPGNVVIDSCCHCGMIWLDCREMAAIEAAPGLR